jgi:septal ring factor EnvC (AmiA/AmiB activator)
MSKRRPPALAALAGMFSLVGALAGCTNLPPADSGTGAPAAVLDRSADDDARSKLHAAVQATQPGSTRLGSARRTLERLLADDGAEARAWHPYARALLEQIRERQRLATLNEHLQRAHEALDRSAGERARVLAELRRQHHALQGKLDDLTEIERRLEPSATPTPAADPPADAAERR